MNKQEILSAFNFRHACKIFDTEKKISDENINFILETARLSPSSFGFEPWHFVVVQNKNLRDKLKENAWGATAKLETASHFVLGLTMRSSQTKYNSAYIVDFMRNIQKLPESVVEGKGRMFEDFQKKDFDLNTDRQLLDWATKQNYLAFANMMTSAALIGIDSCPMEGFDIEISENILKNEFELDMEKYALSYMVAFGYRVNETREKTRRPFEEVVTFIR